MDRTHLTTLEEGADIWNHWREENPSVKPDLGRAHLNGADLKKANLNEANLSNADLSGARIINVELNGATLTDCRVFGISVWGLKGLEEAEQSNLIITPEGESLITVDDVEVAQFIYLMFHSEKIRNVLNTIGKKVC